MVMTSTLIPWYPSRKLDLTYSDNHARINPILRKADFTPSADAHTAKRDVEKLGNHQTHPRLPSSTVHQITLNHLSLLNLLSAWPKPSANTMRTRILDEERDSRLALCCTTTVLKEALRLLGVEAQTRCKPYLKRLRAFLVTKKNPTHGVELFWRL